MYKKVLLISPTSLSKLGGIETYNNLLVNILKVNFPDVKIDFTICFSDEKENINDNNVNYYYPYLSKLKYKKNKFSRMMELLRIYTKSRKYIYKMVNKNDYDLIIDCTLIYFKKLNSLDNYFLVQHTIILGYIYHFFKANKYRSKLEDLFFWITLNKKNTLKNLSNFVVFDNKNKDEAIKYTNAKIWEISLSAPYKQNNISSSDLLSRKSIIYFGRILEAQKNISGLIKINEQINLIDFYGQISSNADREVFKILKEKKWYKSQLSKSEIQEIVPRYKFSISYSNYEGFPFSLVESLCLGVPIIVKNTFTSASFLCNKETGLLLDANNSLEKDIKLIQEFYNMDFNDYKKLCESCKEFYSKNLSYDIFCVKWLHIFDRYLK